MPVEVKQLLNDQRIIIEWIAKIVVNYKKLSEDNVNYDVTKRRLDALNAKWKKAQTLHSTIDYEASEEKEPPKDAAVLRTRPLLKGRGGLRRSGGFSGHSVR